MSFLIGYSFFGMDLQSTCFDDNIPIGDTHEMDFENVSFDEVKIDTGNYSIANPQKTPWNTHTIFDWQCNDLNFEAGNVTLAGMPIEFLRIKKKKDGELQWNAYKDIVFDPTKTEYNWSDYFIESLATYDYAVVPVGANDVEGEYGIQSVDTDYENVFVLGAGDVQYKFRMNMTIDSIQNVSETAFVTTLGRQYPYKIRNGNVKYKKGHLKALLITDSTIYNNQGIDRKAEKQLRDDVFEFLTDGNPKMYKDGNGYYILIGIDENTVKIDPDNNVNRSLGSIEFDFDEIGDANSMQTLYMDSLIEVKPS